MNAFYEHHRDRIRFEYRCFDRILLNGLIQPFQQPERLVGFFSSYRQLYPVSRDVLRGAAKHFQAWAKEQAAGWGAPIVEAPKGRRDEFVEPHFKGAATTILPRVLCSACQEYYSSIGIFMLAFPGVAFRGFISSVLNAGTNILIQLTFSEIHMIEPFASIAKQIARLKSARPLLQEAILTRRGLRDPRTVTKVPGYLVDADKDLLYKYAKALGKHSIIVEIGSFLGLSAIIMGSSNRRCKIVCIDPCDLSGEETSAELYRTHGYQGAKQFRRLRINLILYGVRAKIIRATSQEAIKRFSGRCQLLFVDGDHSYEACFRDVELYGNRLETGGALILHDATELGWPGPIKVAQELLEDSRWKFLEKSGYCMAFRKIA